MGDEVDSAAVVVGEERGEGVRGICSMLEE
jgi:hypothetical protein